MTREAMIQEITQLPDDVLTAVLNLIKATGMIKPADTQLLDSESDSHKYRKAGALKGKIILHEDFDAPLEDMKEYM